ncbi:hypothetical protein AAFG13_38540 [Bradyrhizobium sp. B124]|uniref:hypothetical protein n=1 Tax=Bradyrhizobium sp. B124 TaxID=3140245 RepID=UPI0031836B04
MLLDGEVDAVLSETSDDPRLRSLFADPKSASEAWFQKNEIVPINHVVVTKALHDEDPGSIREIYRLLKRSNELCSPQYQTLSGWLPCVLPADRDRLAERQKLISRHLRVEELISDLTASLA